MVTLPNSSQQLEVPPVEGWGEFLGQFAAEWEQGDHVFFDGPTKSGKTVCAHELAWLRRYVVVLGTKPRDQSLDAYIADGYERIESWPPTRKQVRDATFDDGAVRFVLWPKITKREQLRAFSPAFKRCLDDLFIDGGWTIVADEGLWLSSRKGLDLGDQLDAIGYGGRSSGVTLMMLAQRPRGIPINSWVNSTWAFLWKSGHTDDQRELASLGTYRPREVQDAIRSLRGHQFLCLPCRGGVEWAISQVELRTG